MTALVDVGSTFAKLTVVDERGAVITRARIPSSHPTLAAELAAHVGAVDHACSSAGGGLRIAVIGLEPLLTVEAARRVAQGAGGRVVVAVAGRIDVAGAARLREAAPDVVLLTGGTDGGDHDTVVANARALARLDLGSAFVIAANAAARAEVRRELAGSPLVRVVANVLPSVGVLSAAPARDAIRELFAEHVIRVGRFPDATALEPVIRMPTPSAVLTATELLATLLDQAVVVCDVGGATTDVHSALRTTRPGPVPDDRVTRTVEGDLGIRASAHSLVAAAIETGLVAGEDRDRLGAAADRRSADHAFAPTDPTELQLDAELGGLAVTIALERHAGRLAVRLEEGGASLRPTGRDLRDAAVFIVTGGVFEHADDAAGIAGAAWRRGRDRRALLAARPTVAVDRGYVLAAAGLLASVADRPRAELLLRRELVPEVMARA